MSRPRALAASILIAAALAGAAPTARAQDPQEIAIARQTAIEGLAAYKAGEFDKALKLFEQARAVYASAQILRMHGYTLLALREWEKSAQAMEASLASTTGPLNDADRKDVQAQLEKAMAHLGLVTVTTHLPDAELFVDGGEAIPLPLTKPIRLLEGKYHLAVRSPDKPEITRELEVDGGKKIEVALDPDQEDVAPATTTARPTPHAPPPPVRETSRAGWFPGQRTVGFVAVGTGVALGAAALVTALAGASVRSQVEDDVATHEKNYGKSCNEGDVRLCRFDRAVINNDADRADSLRDASVWMGIGAGVLAAGGAVLLVFAPWGSPAEPAKASVACGPGIAPGLACSGRF